MLFSYDVFDTILYRKVPKSTDVFRVMERKPAFSEHWSLNGRAFSDCRRRTEAFLRRTRIHETTIDSIYSEVARRFDLSQGACSYLKELEFETELELSFLNGSICEEIRQLMAAGERVVLISDMYWNAERIQSLLRAKDPIFQNVQIYVSCDHNASKANGNLFKVVKKLENAEYGSWLHTGDNRHSDYRMPRALGIRSKLVAGPKIYQYERSMGGYSLDMAQVYGIVVQARQNSTGEAFDLGVSFAAPMVYQYMDWVLSEAEHKRIEQLFFVLRDGYILKKVADEMISRRGIKMKTAYVFGSRVAWRFPKLSVEKLRELSVWEKSNWIFRDPAYAYVPFERLGFSKEELDQQFGENFSNQKLYTFKAFKDVLAVTLADGSFCEKLEEKIRLAGDCLNDYFLQIIDPGVSYAFVDTNSTGKTQRDLNDFFAQRHPEYGQFRFFYHTYLAGEAPDCESQFVFSNADEADMRFPEALFRAPYNPCYGYRRKEDGYVEPVFLSGARCSWHESFDYDEFLSGILALTTSLERERSDAAAVNVAEYASLLLRVANFDCISNDIISIMGAMPFNPDLDGNEVLDFYPRLRGAALLHPFTQLIYYPKGSFYLSKGGWPYIYKVLYGLVRLKRRLRSDKLN